jgi:hypothetical protein
MKNINKQNVVLSSILSIDKAKLSGKLQYKP